MAKVLSRLQILLHANTANYRRDIKSATSETKREMQSVSAAAVTASKKIDTALGSILNIKNALLGASVMGFASSVLSTADNMQDLASKVRVSTDSAEEYTAVLQQLRNVSRDNAASYAATVELYADSRRALKELGKSQMQTIQFTDNLTKAMRVGGGEAQAQAAALTQLGQALASGVLRGDEFNSVAEQAPVLLDLLAKELGTTRGALRGLAAEGALTSDVIYNAITKATDVLDEQLSKMPVTVSQALGVFRDQYGIFVDDIINQNSTIGQGLAQTVLVAARNFDNLAKAGIALGTVWAANTVASSGLVTSLMGVVGAQVASARAAVANAMSTQGQIAAVNALNTNMMLLRMTKTQYIVLAKDAIASTVAFGRSLAGLAGLAGSFKASTVAASLHNRAIAAGNVAKRAATASAILATSATKKMGGALKSVATLVTSHPLLMLATVLAAVVVQTEGLQGAMDSLGDALSVVGVMVTDLASTVVTGFGWMWDTASSFLVNLIGGSDTATAASSAYFADLFAGTEGGFVGMIQVAASVLDNMLSAVVAFATMSWTNLNQFVISVKNAFKAMGNTVISIFESMVNAGIGRINVIIDGINTLKSAAAGAKELFGFSGNYTPTSRVAPVKLGRLQYEDTNYASYSATRASINITATRNYADSAVARSKSARAAADAAASSLNNMGTAATGAGKAADKAGKTADKAGKTAKEATDKTKNAVDELTKAYEGAIAQLDKSIAMIGAETEFEKWRYDLNDATNELYKLNEAQKQHLLAKAAQFDMQTAIHAYKQESKELYNQISLARTANSIQRELLEIRLHQERELEKYNALKQAGMNLDYEEISAALEERTIWAEKVAIVNAHKAIVADLKDEDTQRLDTLKEQLSVLEQIERMNINVDNERKKLLDGIALSEYESIYSDDSGPMSDYYKIEDAAEKAFSEYSKQASALEQLRAENLIKEDVYQEQLLALQSEYAKKRGDIEKDLAMAQDAIIANKAASIQTVFSGLTDATKSFMGEQATAYKAMFGLQQTFVMAAAGLNMWKAYSDAMAEGATLPQKFAAAATIAGEFANIISAARAITFDLQGYREGGFTGYGKRSSVAGVVHGQEFVAHADATRRYRPELEAMNRGTYERKTGNTSINVNVTVTGSGQGSVESNHKLGRQIGHGIEGAILRILEREKRPGGLLYA